MGLREVVVRFHVMREEGDGSLRVGYDRCPGREFEEGHGAVGVQEGIRFIMRDSMFGFELVNPFWFRFLEGEGRGERRRRGGTNAFV